MEHLPLGADAVALPVALFLVVPLVFVVTAGEIDLSFPATMGFSAWIFALVVHAGFTPYLGAVAGIAAGMILGLVVGSIVFYFNLSSLVATLGMNFLLRGLIQIADEGMPIDLSSLSQSSLKTIFSSVVFGVPTQALSNRLRDLRRAPLRAPSFRRSG